MAKNIEAGVAVMKMLAGFEPLHQPRLGIAGVEAQRVRKAGTVGQQMMRGDGTVYTLDGQPWQIIKYGTVEIDFALFPKLEQGDAYK